MRKGGRNKRESFDNETEEKGEEYDVTIKNNNKKIKTDKYEWDHERLKNRNLKKKKVRKKERSRNTIMKKERFLKKRETSQ